MLCLYLSPGDCDGWCLPHCWWGWGEGCTAALAGHLIAKEPAIFCAFDRNRTWEEIVPTASLC